MSRQLCGKAIAVGPDRRSEWNTFVTGHPHGHFMQLWEFGEIRQATGWRPHYFVVEGEHGMEAAALVLERGIPGLGSVLYSPGGPLWSAGDSLAKLTAAIRAVARTRGAFVWRVEPYAPEGEALGDQLALEGFRALDMTWSYWNQPKYIMLLSLEGGKDVVLKGIDGKDRYKIRYASKHGVEMRRVPVNQGTVGELHRVMSVTAKKKGIFVHDASWYAHFLQVFADAGHAALFLACKGDQTVSAGVSMIMGSRAWLMYLGSDYTAALSSWALQWEMVAWAIGMGCAYYDFRGPATSHPPHPQDKGYGVYSFKKSFGARLEPLTGYFDLVLGPRRYRALRWAEKRLFPAAERVLDFRARWLPKRS